MHHIGLVSGMGAAAGTIAVSTSGCQTGNGAGNTWFEESIPSATTSSSRSSSVDDGRFRTWVSTAPVAAPRKSSSRLRFVTLARAIRVDRSSEVCRKLFRVWNFKSTATLFMTKPTSNHMIGTAVFRRIVRAAVAPNRSKRIYMRSCKRVEDATPCIAKFYSRITYTVNVRLKRGGGGGI